MLLEIKQQLANLKPSSFIKVSNAKHDSTEVTAVNMFPIKSIADLKIFNDLLQDPENRISSVTAMFYICFIM